MSPEVPELLEQMQRTLHELAEIRAKLARALGCDPDDDTELIELARMDAARMRRGGRR